MREWEGRDYIRIPKENVAIAVGVDDSETVYIRVNTMDELDHIIQQCRDIKLSWMEGGTQ